jgi:template-activating factor I
MSEPEAKRVKIEENSKAKAEAAEGAAALNHEAAEEAETQQVLTEIDKVQSEIDTLNEKASEEILKVEQKYNDMRKPHFDKRNELIKKVPNFWVTTFLNHPTIRRIVTEEEEECLHYLTKVEVEEFADIKSGYRIKFFFDANANPFFENPEIVKEFHLSDVEPTSSTTEIKWKQGKKKLTNGKGEDSASKDTFFVWLCNNSDPIADDIAELIKDDVWPNPVQYFLSPDIEDGDDDDEEGLSEDDDLDEEDGGENEDDDEEGDE